MCGVLRGIPSARACNALIPVMVGQANGGKSVFLCVGENILIRLLGMAGAGGNLRMNVNVVVDFELYSYSPL